MLLSASARRLISASKLLSSFCTASVRAARLCASVSRLDLMGKRVKNVLERRKDGGSSVL
jgi:hypothetical protein